MTDKPLFAATAAVPDRDAGCAGKVRYDGPFAAARALKKISKRRGLDRKAAIYHCVHCGGYHIGHA